MTHQSHQTNGASLEDCHTNFFALTDLCGIKWRKFVNSERHNASSDPLSDPILRSYSRCMQADILCVWRRIQSTKPDSTDLNNLTDEVNNTKVHAPLSLAAAKELWIFWYGEEPDLTDLVDAELLRVAANQATWNGTWERGLTYECRSLLFKALHNLMERFVLTKDIVRFGKWFVQPCTSNECIFGESSQHLSFSFTFFVHGDTVCASIDLREHPAVRPLTKEHLIEAAAALAAANTNASNANEQTLSNHSTIASAEFISGGDSGNTGGCGSVNINYGGDTMAETGVGSGGGGSNNLKPRKVILAPFGMAATLTGNSYKANDPMAEKILEDWASFFPLCTKDNNDVPPVVEVISGGHKMYHPSIYVLVTDLDDMEEMETQNSSSMCGVPASTAEAASLAAISSGISTVANVSTNINCVDNDVIRSIPPYGTIGRQPLLESASINYLNKSALTASSLASSLSSIAMTTATAVAAAATFTTAATTATAITTATATAISSTLAATAAAAASAVTAASTGGRAFTNVVDRFKMDSKNSVSSSMLYDKSNNHHALTSKFTCNMTNTHAPPQVATEMPERVWQECVTNTLHIKHQHNALNTNPNSNTNGVNLHGNGIAGILSSSASIATSSTTTATLSTTTISTTSTSTVPVSLLSTGITSAVNNTNNNNNKSNISIDNLTVNDAREPVDSKTNVLLSLQPKRQLWEFVDPTLKAPCVCANLKSLIPTSTAAITAVATSSSTIFTTATNTNSIGGTSSFYTGCSPFSSSGALIRYNQMGTNINVQFPVSIKMHNNNSFVGAYIQGNNNSGGTTAYHSHHQNQQNLLRSSTAASNSWWSHSSYGNLNTSSESIKTIATTTNIKRVPFHKRHTYASVAMMSKNISEANRSNSKKSSNSPIKQEFSDNNHKNIVLSTAAAKKPSSVGHQSFLAYCPSSSMLFHRQQNNPDNYNNNDHQEYNSHNQQYNCNNRNYYRYNYQLNSNVSGTPKYSSSHTVPSAFTQISTTCSSDNSTPKSRSLINVQQQQISAGTTPVHSMANCASGINSIGNSSFIRNASSMDAMAVPSVDSPNTPNPSPRPNSAISQPTSVPPADQLTLGMSPRAPTSVSNLQPSPMPIDHLLDKNTPAPTPTDQHDGKSMIASPYVHPTSASVDQPSLPEGSTVINDGVGVNDRPPGSVGHSSSIAPLTTVHQQLPPIVPPQYGTITVKKFELQSSYPTLTNKISQIPSSLSSVSSSASSSLLSNTAMEIKVDPANTSGINKINLGNMANVNAVTSSASSGLPNKLKRTSSNIYELYGINKISSIEEFWKMFELPKIEVRDIDAIANEDCLNLESLYDFKSQDAWSYHTVKRFKPNELTKSPRIMSTKNLYENQMHVKPLMPSPRSIFGPQLQNNDTTIGRYTGSCDQDAGILDKPTISGLTSLNTTTNNMNNVLNANPNGGNNGTTSILPGGGSTTLKTDKTSNNYFEELDIKTEIMPSVVCGTSSISPCKEAKSTTGGNLFTVEGLNPSPNDLEQLFETSSNDDCTAMHIHTPPNSNNPSNGCGNASIDDLKRNNNNNNTSTNSTVSTTIQQQTNASSVMISIQNCSNTPNSMIVTPSSLNNNGVNNVIGGSGNVNEIANGNGNGTTATASGKNNTVTDSSADTVNGTSSNLNNNNSNSNNGNDIVNNITDNANSGKCTGNSGGGGSIASSNDTGNDIGKINGNVNDSNGNGNNDGANGNVNSNGTDLISVNNNGNTIGSVNSVNSGFGNGSTSGGSSGPNTIQAEDLTKMFPTPPSHEQHHPNSSPCHIGDIHMTDLNVVTSLSSSTIDGTTNAGNGKIKQEYPIALGSPVEEPIKDWSYVYRPPQYNAFIGSSKYAPLTNLPSHRMAQLLLTPQCIYKPLWQKSRHANQQHSVYQTSQHQKPQMQHHHSTLQQQQQHHQHQPPQLHSQHYQYHSHNQHQHQQLHELLSAAPRTPLQQPRTPLGPMSSSPMHNSIPTPLSSGGGGSGGILTSNSINTGNVNTTGGSLLLSQLNCPQAALTSNPPTMQQLMQRAGMSPISPAQHGAFPHTSPLLQAQQRQTPIHPPPPYEVAVASPALSTTSSTVNYLNKQYHSQDLPHTPQSVVNMPSVGGPPSASGPTHSSSAAGALVTRELPEVSSLIVNILLYDTALNVFRDHNFDSSTVCVCNADSQRIGNIRGADSGVYVPLPGTTFNPLPQQNMNQQQQLQHQQHHQQQQSANATAIVGNIRTLSAFSATYTGGVGGGGVMGNNTLGSPASLAGAGSSSSTTPSTATPATNGTQQHITGYVDEDPVECTCGFSSVINRRLAYRAGLFYEDELEITGIAEDPGRNKKHSLMALINSLSPKQHNNHNNSNNNISSSSNSSTSSENSPTDKIVDELTYSIFDLLLEQCSIIQTSSSAVHRVIQRHRRRTTTGRRNANNSIYTIANVLEYMDANDIITLALEQARLAFDNTRMQIMDQPVVHYTHHKSGTPSVLAQQHGRLNVHKWPYIPVGFTRSNKDIVATMKSIQPMLQNAFHSKSRSAAGTKDATYTVSGPLTWRQFHRLAGRASGQCEPQPIPSIIVGHDRDWISVAPLAIHYWDKFLLEPYSYARDVVYMVIAPDNDYVIGKTKTYFKELSTTYEMCKLGRHTPMCGWGGMLTVGQRPPTEKTFSTNLDSWLRSLDDTTLAEKLRLYAHVFQNMLLPYLNRIPGDKSLLNPPEGMNSHSSPTNARLSSNGLSSSPTLLTSNSLENSERGVVDHTSSSTPMELSDGLTQQQQQQSTIVNSITGNTGATLTAVTDNKMNSNNLLNDNKTIDMKPDVKPPLILGDPLGVGEAMEEVNPPAIVLYVVEPFTYGSDSPELERLVCIVLLRMYAELLKSIPDSVRVHLNIQIISLESILELGRMRNRNRFSDEIKCLALNIFSQCRRHMIHAQAVKSLTGFGTAANMEAFLKSKDEQNRRPYKMFTPPYVLAPMHEKNDKTDFSRANSGGMRGNLNEQKYSVMYCNYCMSEDQSWLLATVTDDRGEMLEKVCINIDVPNRTRRRKVPARRIGLSKLMDFIIGLISQTTQTWRLVIGRIGRIGHGELKSWSALLSKQNLQKVTKQLKDLCKQCQLVYPPSILSACLVTLEPDAKLRVMPDQFTPDERFSQISIQNPLSTPQDVTCTHILVFPTSAVCLSFTRQFQNEPQVDLDNDFLNFEEDENEAFADTDLDDLLIWENRGISDHNSPDRLEDNRSWQSASGNNFSSAQQQDVEEVGSINQQPLAVGYLVSTAPTGRMPSWFWSACPHMEDVCPVFLKTALHLHVPNIQTTDDILNSTNAHSSATDHPLDSTLTADVLRYVLEGYNALSWLALDSNTHDRLSCLPINVQVLMNLYNLTAAIA